ncbi:MULTISPECIES: hypothetical protein [unclassified Streptomyces]|uniref:hypothetical protein n=1 Tax=unclassified Streptomyces TaxID=2593676 RepID=UPI002DD8FF41|nr:hypothetical protein [Streptomyces sp. NBC_01257]WRZ68480.1 hypothetical protein OG408_33400 [Streptomyces sp. NBC_01257]
MTVHQILALDPFLNNQAATTPENLTEGRLNVWRNSLPAQPAPLDIVVDDVPLRSAPLDGRGPDNVLCSGQRIEVPERRWDWLYVIGCGERRVRDVVTWHFSNGTVDRDQLALSDLWEGRSDFGEDLALRTDVIHYPHHVQERIGITLWCQRVPVTSRKPLGAMSLPRNPAVHLFAMTLVGRQAGVDSASDPQIRGSRP